ncbi:GTP 3',8-cyclase MoaA [Myxococcus llanfairpwllgwyngyllgogerychwyrndrobwllllantysiliogogogochensis]|uniref:GTP 3',8-cyclase n=1 Tax=Myxococcus llanfairpwllgwyngyllgogerychwyrndrobwllllantysiliogogogochensis TaxID=2590453 RepID=A0A540WPC6_9BACT|nr:GTP 3',8-cyclase MoaA [Myxococcus llanfairpwllgwyngyllgogerychwyrndrobwllllantysiliogogogochensis]NTX02121.1 GTP 3',8-cyclase MoaA [Myxococcus sp. CA040A]NTX14413.1 GTP 3',8-cyclase MoaA [Myxococcus sp. CA056]NTX51632.1 GTP 3',8-cyclase MoaA [Myxococcus sp. CA039A]TQF10840.1 GTP 3',8-cyclase MoaA [Myxococcus llanfairpwllgwyngyllgogerychwyrndrobwllllantysiliogogogochensis]
MTTPALQTDPLAPPLLDAQGRRMTYLRLSITDRCNFRCTYCSPASWGGKKDLLNAEELGRIAGIFAALGIRRVRLTGGEPLIRPDILEIARRIASIPGVRHLAITTNASHLEALAAPLREAGVDQLNLSLDTLSPETFRRISKQGDFDAILRGIDAAAASHYASLKLNVVVMRGVNDGEARALVEYAHARGITPRFIELMPFGQGVPVPTAELMDRLRGEGLDLSAEPEETGAAADSVTSGPARYWKAPGGRVGFISPLTQNFCGGCNRVRVASNGDLRSCLGGRAQAPLHQLIRGGATDVELARAIRAALGDKPEGHRFTEPGNGATLLSMMGIGG